MIIFSELLDLAVIQQEAETHFQNYLLTGGFPLPVKALNLTEPIPAYIYHTYLQWVLDELSKLGKPQHYFKQITQTRNCCSLLISFANFDVRI